MHSRRAVSSVGERFLDTEEVTCSIHVPPTISVRFFGFAVFVVEQRMEQRGLSHVAKSEEQAQKLPRHRRVGRLEEAPEALSAIQRRLLALAKNP